MGECGKSMGRTWAECGQNMGKVWAEGRPSMGECGRAWVECGKSMGRTWAECGQSMGRQCAEHGQNVGRAWAEHGQNVGRALVECQILRLHLIGPGQMGALLSLSPDQCRTEHCSYSIELYLYFTSCLPGCVQVWIVPIFHFLFAWLCAGVNRTYISLPVYLAACRCGLYLYFISCFPGCVQV